MSVTYLSPSTTITQKAPALKSEPVKRTKFDLWASYHRTEVHLNLKVYSKVPKCVFSWSHTAAAAEVNWSREVMSLISVHSYLLLSAATFFLWLCRIFWYNSWTELKFWRGPGGPHTPTVTWDQEEVTAGVSLTPHWTTACSVHVYCFYLISPVIIEISYWIYSMCFCSTWLCSVFVEMDKCVKWLWMSVKISLSWINGLKPGAGWCGKKLLRLPVCGLKFCWWRSSMLK